MKKVFCALGLSLVFNLTGAAQKQRRSTESSPEPTSVKSKSEKPSTPSFEVVSGLQAELQNTIDAKNAKVGDRVVLSTTQAVKQDGEIVIPKGTQVIGRVVEVQRRAKNGAASRVGVVFDRLQNKALSTPINATIVSIADLRAAAAVSDDLSADLSGQTMTSAGGGSRTPTGGLLGGVTNTVGGVVGSTTQTVGSVVNSTTGNVRGTTQGLARAVTDLQISTSASGSAQTSTTLSSANKDVRIEKGATFSLNVQKNGKN